MWQQQVDRSHLVCCLCFYDFYIITNVCFIVIIISPQKPILWSEKHWCERILCVCVCECLNEKDRLVDGTCSKEGNKQKKKEKRKKNRNFHKGKKKNSFSINAILLFVPLTRLLLLCRLMLRRNYFHS